MSEQQSRLVVHISAEQARRNTEALQDALRSLTSSGNQLQAELDKAFKGVNATSQGFNKVGAEAHKATSAIDGHIGAVKQLAAAYLSWQTVTKAVQYADNYTGLQNRLKLVTSSQDELTRATKDTFAIAQKTGQQWEVTTQVYQRFAQNADKLNITQAQTARLTETVAKSVATSGASSAAAEAALTQFGQSLASGVFRGEEFNAVAEQTPALLNAIALGLDTDIGKLRAMAANSELTADVLVTALSNAADKVDGDFSKIDLTVSQSLVTVRNAVQEYIGEFDKAHGVTHNLSDAAKGLAGNMDSAGPIAMSVAVGYLTKSVGVATVAILDKAKANIAARQATIADAQANLSAAQADLSRAASSRQVAAQELAEANATLSATQTRYAAYASHTQVTAAKSAQAAASARLTATIAAETAAEKSLVVAKTAATAATSGIRAAVAGLMGLLGGPAGLIGMAASVAAYFLLVRDNSDAATPSIDAQAKSVGELAEAYSKMNEAQRQIELRKVTEQLEEVSSSAEDAQKQLRYVLNNPNLNNYADGAQKAAIQEVFQALSDGSISAAEAVERLRVAGVGSVEYLSKVQDAAVVYDGWRQKVISVLTQHDLLNGKLDASKIASDKAAEAQKNLGNSIGGVATKLSDASKEWDNYSSKLNAQMSQDKNELFYLRTGSTAEQAKAYSQAMSANGGAPLTIAQRQQIDESIKLRGAITDLTDATKGNGSKSTTARSKDDLAKLAKDPNVRKMLQIIAYTEGTDARHGYNTLVGGNRINDLSQHPNVVGLRTKDGPSTAFGRYQIVNSTWKRLQKQWGFNDFSASTQDQAAIALMQSRGGLNDVLNGNFGAAINKFGSEWVSLPSSKNKNQGKRSWADVNRMLGSSIDTESYDQQVSEAERRAKAVADVEYKYADERKKAEIDFNKEISEMRQNLTGQELAKYEAAAKASYDKKLEELENEKKLTELANEERIYQGEKFLLTKEEQIKREIDLEKKRIIYDKKLTGQEKMDALSMKLAEEQFKLAEPYREFLKTVKQTEAIEAYQKKVGWLGQAMKDGAIDVTQFKKEMEELNKSKPDALKTDFEKNWGSTKQWIDEANDIQARLDQGMAGWLQSSSDALAEFVATGKMNFSDFTNSVVKDLTRIAMQKAIAGIVGGMFNYGGATSGAVGTGTTALDSLFATGGYTGDGGKYEPAGIVHRGEYVFTKEETARIGPSRLAAIAKNGYATGGYVGPQQKSGSNVTVNIHNNGDNQVETKESTDANGAPVIDIFVQKVVSEVNKQIATNGSTGKIMQSVFGVQRKPR